MRMEIDVLEPIPANLNKSYGEMEFYNFGLMMWEYERHYFGPVHWINQRKTCIEPEFPKPINWKVWFHPGVIYTINLVPILRDDIADTVVGTAICNILTGKGFPMKLPP